MKQKTLAILALLIVALAACETRVIMPQPNEQPNTISVQGISDFEVAPDIAKIRFTIETQSLTAQDAQNRNRDLSNAAVNALATAGVQKSEMETRDYRVQKIQEWDQQTQRSVDKGYRAENTLVVTTKNLNDVGKLLDVGVQAGANRVDSISFELSDAKQREVKTESLRRAAQNAREKAQALAEGTGISLGAVRSVAENSYAVIPYQRYNMMEVSAAKLEDSPPTPISPGSVQVNAQVSVSYEIG